MSIYKLPRISIVTPSYNQAAYLPSCLASIADQNYPDLEHIVIDGGSTDNSVDIIRAQAARLSHWVSERDAGQYDAINRGLSLATGDVMAWLNSDDVYFPWALQLAGEIFATFPQVEWLTTLHPFAIDHRGVAIKMTTSNYGFDSLGFFNGNNLAGAGWPHTCFIQQESTFWRRSLWDKAGAYIDSSLKYAGDFDLWARFFGHAKLYAVDLPLGIYRRQPQQKTSVALGSYIEEAKASLTRHGGRIPNHRLQAWRLAARRYRLGRAALKGLGQFELAPVITYDWGSQTLRLVEA